LLHPVRRAEHREEKVGSCSVREGMRHEKRRTELARNE
jgi:hypothetical protein